MTEPEMERQVAPPVEFRESNVAGVNFAQRLIEVIAVPYNEEAIVEYRGEFWNESFDPAAFDGIETRSEQKKVLANREHQRDRTIGKVIHWWPSRPEGLVAKVKVSETQLGDETLALARDDVLSASIGFAARGKDQQFDRRTMKRRILRAFADHLAFTTVPAYAGAGVLNVREGVQAQTAATMPRLVTPALDELLAWHRARLAGREG